MAGPNGEYDADDYEFPLPTVPGAPVPSQADYSEEKVAVIIEGFARFIPVYGVNPLSMCMQYENNTPGNTADDIVVKHPGDKDTYLEEWRAIHTAGSAEQTAYEQAAMNSDRLTTFQNTSPAGIEYFQTP